MSSKGQWRCSSETVQLQVINYTSCACSFRINSRASYCGSADRYHISAAVPSVQCLSSSCQDRSRMDMQQCAAQNVSLIDY